MGPQQGRKVFTLQTLPDCSDGPLTPRTGNVAGFSLHAGVTARAHERAKLERLWLKTPYANDTTHVMFEPLDFISRLVALIPKPRVNLTRFHGIFA